MAVDLLAKLRELIGLAEADDDDVGDGIGEASGDEVDEVEADAEVDADAEDGEVEADEVADTEGDEAEEAGDGATDADQAEGDDNAETLPAAEVSESELRDALVKLGAENESLRTRIAELGGDAEVEADAVEAEVIDEVDDHYDDEAATLDLETQRAEIAALMGTAN